jgi:hypothetical protein
VIGHRAAKQASFQSEWRGKTKRTQPKQQDNALMNLANSCLASEVEPVLREGGADLGWGALRRSGSDGVARDPPAEMY